MTLKDSFTTLSERLLQFSLDHEYQVDLNEFKLVIENNINDLFVVQFCFSKEFEGFFVNAYKSNRLDNTLQQLEAWRNVCEQLIYWHYMTDQVGGQLLKLMYSDVDERMQESFQENQIEEQISLEECNQSMVQDFQSEIKELQKNPRGIQANGSFNPPLLDNDQNGQIQQENKNSLQFQRNPEKRNNLLLLYEKAKKAVASKSSAKITTTFEIMNEQDILSDGVQIALTKDNFSAYLKRHNDISITLERKISLLIFLRYMLARITECFDKDDALKGTTLRVYIYGSLCTGTSLNNDSDIDVEMKLIGRNQEIPYAYVLKKLKNLQSICLHVQKLSCKPIINQNIRVPLVSLELDVGTMLQFVDSVGSLGSKIFYPNQNQYDDINNGNRQNNGIFSHSLYGVFNQDPLENSKKSNALKIDLIYDNQLGVLNSQLLRNYMEINPKIVVLCLLFKDWAAAYKLKSPRKLTSYALTNMVLYYLIKKNYIRSLQDNVFFGFSRTNEKLTVFECMEEKQLIVTTSFLTQGLQQAIRGAVKDKNLKDLESVSIDDLFIELLVFYEEYSNQLWRHQEVERISTRPEYLKEQEYPQSYFQDKKTISIQDPFEPEYDIGSRNDFFLAEFVDALHKTIEWTISK